MHLIFTHVMPLVDPNVTQLHSSNCCIVGSLNAQIATDQHPEARYVNRCWRSDAEYQLTQWIGIETFTNIDI